MSDGQAGLYLEMEILTVKQKQEWRARCCHKFRLTHEYICYNGVLCISSRVIWISFVYEKYVRFDASSKRRGVDFSLSKIEQWQQYQIHIVMWYDQTKRQENMVSIDISDNTAWHNYISSPHWLVKANLFLCFASQAIPMFLQLKPTVKDSVALHTIKWWWQFVPRSLFISISLKLWSTMILQVTP